MKKTLVDTGSIDWAILHVGCLSAGEADSLFTTKMELRDGEMPKTLLYKKAAEVFRGQPMVNLSPSAASSWQIEQGILIEEEVIPWYSITYDSKVETSFFCQTDDGHAGCTPDGLIGDDGGIEIKSPEPQQHCRYVIEGRLPTAYIQQVQFSLYVTGRKWWNFISYRRRFPALVFRVERDEAIMERIHNGVETFHAQLATAVEKLKSLQ